MSDHDLLQELGRMARDEGELAHLDERWDRLAAGTLSAEEEKELQRLAAASEDARLAYEAFRPLGEDFQASVLRRIAALSTPRVESAPLETLPDRPAGEVKPFPVPTPSPRPWPARWGAAASALAATVMMLIGVPLLRVPPVPAYTLTELSGGSRTTRGDLAEEPRFAPGDKCRVVLHPVSSVRRPSSLRTEAFLSRGTELRPLAVEQQIDDSGGAVRVTGTLDRDLPPGTWTLWVVVGRKGSLPGPDEVRTFSSTATIHERKWVALPKMLLIQPRAPD